MKRYKNIVKLFPILLILLSFPSRAQSQYPDSVSLSEGSWALQFGIDRDFTLTSFQGTTIGAKYQFSHKNAVRGGITLNGYTNDGSNTMSGAIGEADAGTVPENSSSKSAGINLILQYLWYMNPSGPVHFYAGFGPSVLYSYSNSSSDNYYLNNSSGQGYWVREQYDSKNTQWAIGAAAVVGVEWFACQWLSIHADYNEAIQYQWISSSRNQIESSLTTPGYISYRLNSSGSSKGWRLNNLGVSFGLNIYL